MTLLHRSPEHVLVVDYDQDYAEWDDERHWHIDHPNCELVEGSLSMPGLEYEEYDCGVAYQEMNEGIYLFGGPEYWPEGKFKQTFQLTFYRDYFGEVDMEVETIDA